jgi:FkbM family methyltransferase
MGLVPVTLEGRRAPIWLRAGTDDVYTAQNALSWRGLNIPFSPQTILEIGAGAGYRSAALAEKFPDARIMAVEPDPAVRRVLKLNTLPYPNISLHFCTLSTVAGRYAFADQAGAGGKPGLVEDPAGPIQARSVGAFLLERQCGAPHLAIITPDTASKTLLRAPWSLATRLIAVETGGEFLPLATARCFPEAQYSQTRSGDYVLLRPREAMIVPKLPRAVPVFAPDGILRRLRFAPAGAGQFAAFGSHGFRLAAHRPGLQTTVVFDHECYNYKELHAVVRGTTKKSAVRCVLQVIAAGEKLGEMTVVLQGTEKRTMAMALRDHRGPCEVIVAAEMAASDDHEEAAVEIIATFLG